MEELYKLKETLCNELEEYSKKGKMSAGDLEIVNKLSETIKNIDKIIEDEIGLVFTSILGQCGVFDRNEEGKAQFKKFIASVK